MNIVKAPKSAITRAIAVSQKIEGYGEASKEVQSRVRQIREKYSVKVSAKSK